MMMTEKETAWAVGGAASAALIASGVLDMFLSTLEFVPEFEPDSHHGAMTRKVIADCQAALQAFATDARAFA